MIRPDARADNAGVFLYLKLPNCDIILHVILSLFRKLAGIASEYEAGKLKRQAEVQGYDLVHKRYTF